MKLKWIANKLKYKIDFHNWGRDFNSALYDYRESNDSRILKFFDEIVSDYGIRTNLAYMVSRDEFERVFSDVVRKLVDSLDLAHMNLNYCHTVVSDHMRNIVKDLHLKSKNQ